MLDVLIDLKSFKRLQMIAHGDALAKLTEARIVQAVAQLGLSHQYNLKQFAVISLQIGEQSHLFEQFICEVLRFVDNQNRFASVLDLMEKKLVDHRQSIEAIETVDRKAELNGNRLHQLVRAHDWIED